MLALAEVSYVNEDIGLDSHLSKRLSMRDRRDDQPPLVLETDEPSVEQMINGWGQQETILPIEPLLVI